MPSKWEFGGVNFEEFRQDICENTCQISYLNRLQEVAEKTEIS